MQPDLHLCLSTKHPLQKNQQTLRVNMYLEDTMEDADSVAAKAAAPITGQAKGKPRGQRRREPVERCDSPPPPTAADRTQRAESHEEMIALLKCELSRVSRPPCVRRASEPSGRARVLTWRQGGSGRRIFQRAPWRRIRSVTAPSLPGIGRGRQR